MTKASALLAMFTLATMTGACASRPAPQINWAKYEHERECKAELQAIGRKLDGTLRRAYAAEAAYIATHNDKVANKNASMLEAEGRDHQTAMAAYKAKGGG